ncbi:LOW QUALITY PROTEIN: cytokine receptor common subunit beta [Bombina bombina]|uniref:LOW QUALITY PROTEIN: cytokine receptor common subunit beta n=1 Tax=Bombina bombina TaxID=8345 RepID=UPI00235A6209|nr:LOW QUALITY PROTEIN: cytokine receptor common subunit beta [Bombina bombina]
MSSMGVPCSYHVLCILNVLLSLQGVQGAAVLESLSCTNDYSTHWMCHWKERTDAHRVVPLGLYYEDSVSRSRCVPSYPQPDGPDGLQMSCRVNVSGFIITMKANFTFLPEHIIQSTAEITPAHRVQVPPPQGLMIRSEDGQLIMTWKTPSFSNPSLALVYQMTYCRKDWEKWEDAPSVNVEELEVRLDAHLFVPGSTYLFRVRARIKEGQNLRGIWSTWSKALDWEVPKDDEENPQNFQCVYDGLVEMKCSWEVRSEVTSSVMFALYYTQIFTKSHKDATTSPGPTSVTREKLCLPTTSVAKAGFHPTSSTSCTLQVPPSQAQSSFNIQVRPMETVKTLFLLRISLVVLLPTCIVTLWSMQDDAECPDHMVFNVSGNLLEYYIPNSELQGTTMYSAQVRSQPEKTLSHNIYSGPWSEWSIKTSWKTKKAVDERSIYYAVPIGVLLLICTYTGHHFFKRSKKEMGAILARSQQEQSPTGEWSLTSSTNSSEEGEEPYPPELAVDTLLLIGEREDANKDSLQSNEGSLRSDTTIPSAEDNTKSHHSAQEVTNIGGPQDSVDGTITERIEQLTNIGCMESYLMSSRAQSMLNLASKKIRNPDYVTLPRCHDKLWMLPEKNQTPFTDNELNRSQMGYVLGMGAQAIQQQSKKQTQVGLTVPDRSYISVPLPSDIKVPSEGQGPLMIINHDGAGPLMLKQVGDYCFFPGLRGSQEKLESKVASQSRHKEPPIILDTPLPAVQAFKVMQRGYLTLPGT